MTFFHYAFSEVRHLVFLTIQPRLAPLACRLNANFRLRHIYISAAGSAGLVV